MDLTMCFVMPVKLALAAGEGFDRHVKMMVEGELLRGWARKFGAPGVSQYSNSCFLPYEGFQEASFWRSCVVYLVDGREILENENSDNCGLILENATSNSIPVPIIGRLEAVVGTMASAAGTAVCQASQLMREVTIPCGSDYKKMTSRPGDLSFPKTQPNKIPY
jgi:hypothetical protein